MLALTSSLVTIGRLTATLCRYGHAKRPDIKRGIKMVIESISATQTFEPTTVSFCSHRTTFATAFTCIPWVYKQNPASFSFCFIFDEFSKLTEIPSVNPFVMSTSFSFPYIGKVFHNNSISFVERFYDFFADTMVYIPFKPLLSARHFFKMSFSRFCAFFLKGFTQMFIVFHHRQCFVMEKHFIRCNSSWVYSDINTNSFTVATQKRVGVNISGDHNMQKHPLFFSIKYKVSSINFPVEILLIIISNFNRYLNATFDTAKRYLIWFETKTTGIISYWKKLFENRFRTMFSKHRFQNFTGFITTAYNKLTWKVNKVTNSFISSIMQQTPMVDILFKTNICNNLCRLAVLFHSFKKNLVKRYLDFNGSNSFNHTEYYVEKGFKCFHPIPPLVETSGFLGGIL